MIVLVIASLAIASACRSDDPARAALRARLAQPAPMTSDELGRVRAEVGAAIQGKHVRINLGADAQDLTAEQRTVVLGMLTEPAGLFDEGLREQEGRKVRVLNAPGASDDPEIEATRRLYVDIETLLPRRFEFTYAFPGHADYSYDLIVAR